MSEPQSPEGVCLIAADGTEYPCDMLRDGVEDGVPVWIAVPRVPVLPSRSWSLEAEAMPVCVLRVRLQLALK